MLTLSLLEQLATGWHHPSDAKPDELLHGESHPLCGQSDAFWRMGFVIGLPLITYNKINEETS